MSAQTTGFAQAALLYGYQSRILKAPRKFGNFKGYITLEETHQDEVEITEHPIEQGASITDHAFKRPAELTLKIAWSNSPNGNGLLGGIRGLVNTGNIVVSNLLGTSSNQVNEIYQKLLDAQSAREPMEAFTGKRSYTDMLIKSLITTTDKNTENVLAITVVLRQIIRVTTSVLTIDRTPAANQQNPGSTQAPTNSGTKQLVPTNNVDSEALQNFINPR